MAKKFLVIEDDAAILFAIAAKLRVDGFSVETEDGTTNPEIIMRRIKTINPDYIILDLLLPKIDGFKLLREIKSDDEINKAPVFVFTNLSDNDSREKCGNLGADYFLLKTELNIDEFVQKIKKIIYNRYKINKKLNNII